MLKGIIPPCGRDFPDKLDNAFNQLTNAYLDAFSFIERMLDFEDTVSALRKVLSPRERLLPL